MGRTKASIAVAGAVTVLVGVVAAVAMGTGGSDHVTRRSDQAAATAPGSGASYVSPTVPPITAAPAKVPGATSTPGTPATTAAANTAPRTPSQVGAQPSAQDIQKLIAGLTAQMQSPSTTGGTAPLTQAQVESQIREQLRLLGITY